MFVTCRQFARDGSLKDFLHHGVSPKLKCVSSIVYLTTASNEHFLRYPTKYNQPEGRPLELRQVALFGRHILEALLAFRSKVCVSLPRLPAG